MMNTPDPATQPPPLTSPPRAGRHLTAARRDLVALVALGALSFAIAQRFGFFGYLVVWGRRFDAAGGDALIVTILVLAFALKVYGWRRWREGRREVIAHARGEAALRRERNFSDAILATAGSLILVLDRRGHIVRFNQACEALTGYRFADVREQPFWELLLLPEEAARVRGVFVELRAGRFPNTYENHWVTRDGQRRLIAWANTALLDDTGAVEYVVATGTDISAQRATEERARVGEARLGMVTAQLPAYLWTTDGYLRLTSFLGGGYAGREAEVGIHLGQTLHEFFATDDHAFPPITAHRRALRGLPAAYDITVRGRPHEVQVEPLRDAQGAIVGCLGLGIDVTERREAQEALAASEARFRAVYEHAAIGIVLADLDRRILACNPAYEHLLGYSEVELRVGTFPIATHPDDAAHDAALFARLIAGQQDSYRLEKRYVHKDGHIVHGHLTASLVRDAAGQPRYTIGLVQDLTALAAATAQLHKQDTALRHLNSGLTAQEWRVLKLLSQHHTTIQIAAHLHIQPETVRRHIFNIGLRLGLESAGRDAVLAAAQNRGLLPPVIEQSSTAR